MPEFVLPFSFGLILSSLTLRIIFQFANESNLKAATRSNAAMAVTASVSLIQIRFQSTPLRRAA
jgi:hypothetical protein